jgi:hypothetical protein
MRRVMLRSWVTSDREPFAAMSANPEVMEHLPSTLSRRESDELVDTIIAGFERNRFGLWAVELLEEGRFIGFTGLSVANFEASLSSAEPDAWAYDPSDFFHGRTLKIGNALTGATIILFVSEPAAFPDKYPAHGYASDSIRITVLGNAPTGEFDYFPGGFRLPEGGKPA